MRRERRRWLVVAGVSLVVFAGAAVATAGLELTGSGDRDLPIDHPRERAELESPRMKAGFAILRRPRTAADELPPPARGVVDKGAPPDHDGANPDLSRHAGARVGTADFWVVPGNDTVCVAVSGGGTGGGGCADTRDALAGRFSHLTGSPSFGTHGDDGILYGLAADGIEEVVVTTADGDHRVPVVDNVWAFAARPQDFRSFTVGEHSEKLDFGVIPNRGPAPPAGLRRSPPER